MQMQGNDVGIVTMYGRVGCHGNFSVWWLILSRRNCEHEPCGIPVTAMQCDEEWRPAYEREIRQPNFQRQLNINAPSGTEESLAIVVCTVI